MKTKRKVRYRVVSKSGRALLRTCSIDRAWGFSHGCGQAVHIESVETKTLWAVGGLKAVTR